MKCITDSIRLFFNQNSGNNLVGEVPLLGVFYLSLFILIFSRRRVMFSYQAVRNPRIQQEFEKGHIPMKNIVIFLNVDSLLSSECYAQKVVN